MTLKKISDQVVVITGASSGIGLITARKMAKAGAKLVLAARSAGALAQLEQEINASGGEALTVVADVGRLEDVQRIAQAAKDRFGGFDTWINNAGLGMFGKMEETPIEDFRRLFETNFWGVVYGSLEAVKELRQRGGALINLGSVVSERVAFLQGMYSATKFAVKGFTDGLRMELEHDGAPVSVTLVQPSAMDSPFAMNARNTTGKEYRLPPPVYLPDLAADAILHVAQHPRRDLVVGGGGKALSQSEQWMPRLTDKMMETETFENLQKKDRPASHDDALYTASERLAERGNYDGYVFRRSFYTRAALHPVVSSLAFFTLGVGLVALWKARTASRLVPPQRRLPASSLEGRSSLSSVSL